MDKRKKKTRPTKASRCEKTGSEFSRWALFEAQVLAKVSNPRKCKAVIAQRQTQVDDDSNEADLVAAHIRLKLREKRQHPETCCIYFTTAEITAWLQEATGTKLAINKTTPYLRTLAIPELRYSKKNGVPGWVWRGLQGKPDQTATRYCRLGYDPGQ